VKSNPKEGAVEGYLKARCDASGGFCLKLNPAWAVGVPDRLACWRTPAGHVRLAFVETKRPKGGRISGAQKWWSARLTALGIPCYYLKSAAEIDTLLTEET
jgi:hypothetical protein